MAFVFILKNDLRTLLRCMNYKKQNYFKSVRPFYCNSVNYYDSEDGIPVLHKPVPDKIISQLKRTDEIPNDFHLIYRAQKTFNYSLAHVGCLTISGVVLPMVTYVLAKNDFKFPCYFNDMLVIHNSFELSAFFTITGIIVYGLYLTVTRFPFRLYRNKSTNDYIASYPHLLLPWKMQKFYFKKGEVILAKDPKFLPMQIGNFIIKNHKTLLVEEFFVRPHELHFMMSKDPS